MTTCIKAWWMPDRSALTGWLSGSEGGPPLGSPPSDPREVLKEERETQAEAEGHQ